MRKRNDRLCGGWCSRHRKFLIIKKTKVRTGNAVPDLRWAEKFRCCCCLFVCAEKQLKIIFYSANPCNAEVFYQNLRYIRAEECRESGTEMDILYPKV